MNLKKGILYVATKDKFLSEAIESVKTVKKVGIELPIAIFVSKDLEKEARNIFDIVMVIDNPKFSFSDKINPLLNSPFEKTLFLDGDTKVYENITYLFDVLDRYDMGFAHAPIRNAFKIKELPDWFVEPNTGVILYKRNERIVDFINNWKCYYQKQLEEEYKPPHDQSAFRYALYFSKCSFYTLGDEFNFRPVFPCVIPGNTTIKISHERLDSIHSKQLYELSKDESEKWFFKRPKVFVPRKENLNKVYMLANQGIQKIRLRDFIFK